MSDSEKLYPNYDISVWMRNCEKEIEQPLEGKVTGELPQWLQGTLLRNGPGRNKIGSSQYKHVFDGLALIHKFTVKSGRVTYRCRFLRSETYKKNMVANRIVITEFGTVAVPDPCRTIFDRISSIFDFSMERTDNAAVSVYPFQDQIYAMTEVPVMYKIDSESLETLEGKPLSNALVVAHTAHPHVMPNGDVYNVGMNVVKGEFNHVVVKFPYSDKGDMFEAAEIVGSAKPRWRYNPAYMHSFGISENYFIIIEQPLCVSALSFLSRYLITRPFSAALVTYPGYETNIILIHRETGVETRYKTNTIFFMHIINCFEFDGKVNIDFCSYKDTKILDAMYVEALESMQQNPDYAKWVQSRPKRIEIPLDASPLSYVETKLIADVGVEAPRINYELYNGRPYRYFYGIGSDVDTEYVGSIIKVDTRTGDYLIWHEPQCYPSEPVFMARPGAIEEDDGVLLSALVWGQDDCSVTLLVLNAHDLKEMARAHFNTPSQVTRCFHGWFLPD